MGSIAAARHRARSFLRAGLLDDLAQDLHQGLRMLRRSPVFTAVAVLSLGLGIGANTAVFSLVDAVLLRSLPVPDPDELRVMDWTAAQDGLDISLMGSWKSSEDGRMAVVDAISYPAFEAVRERLAGRAHLIGFTRFPDLVVGWSGASFVVPALVVTPDFFQAMEVGAALGRVFSPGESEAETATEVVLGHDAWIRRFGGDRGVLGRTVIVSGHRFTVIGVLPEGFKGLHTGDTVGLYVTTAAQPALLPGWSRAATERWWVGTMARLEPGTSEEAFRSAAAAAFAGATEGTARETGVLVHDGRAGVNGPRDLYRRPLDVLLAIVGVVILVVCANLAGLSLARGVAREREFAIRPALGATRGRLLRQSFTESVLLALVGGAAGVVVAMVGTSALARLLLGSSTALEGLAYEPTVDGRVLAFTLALAILAGILSGLLPALRAAGAGPLSGLRRRGAAAGTRPRAGRALVVGQMVLSILLLTGAGLYGRTLLNLVRIDLGFQADHLLLFQVDPGGVGYPEERCTTFLGEASQALAPLPGVRDVALASSAPLSGWWSGGSFFTLPDRPSDGGNSPRAHRITVSEAYFTTLGIPLVAGRGFEPSDGKDAAAVVLVNQRFARSYLGGDPVGQRVRVGDTDWTVVGVSGDARFSGVTEDVAPTVYFSFRQQPLHDAVFLLRTAVDPLTLVDEARAAVRLVDPTVPLFRVETQLQVRNRRIAQERLFATLCAGLAALALLLCCIGLYGLMAFEVARRTGEIGVRVALGATRAGVTLRVLADAGRLTALGVLIGVPAALLLVRLVRSQFYGVEPGDPTSLGGGTLLLVAVVLAAAWGPARQASRIEPMAALRGE